MKTLNHFLLMYMLVIAGCATGPRKSPPNLEGKWEVTSMTVDGRLESDALGTVVIITSDTIEEIRPDGSTASARYNTIDLQGVPYSGIDVHPSYNTNAVLKAIYLLNDNVLKMSGYTEQDETRPKALDEGTGAATLVRIK
jgi:uncharacterized protein (TIGR03067 family)